MRHLTLAFALLATQTFAQDHAIIGTPGMYLGATSVLLQPSTAPNAIAEVVFDNAAVNATHDQGSYSLTMEGLTVDVAFGFNVDALGSDSITVTVPPGYIAIPATLDVLEDQVGVVLIYLDNMM
jgi:hypothetical protein